MLQCTKIKQKNQGLKGKSRTKDDINVERKVVGKGRFKNREVDMVGLSCRHQHGRESRRGRCGRRGRKMWEGDIGRRHGGKACEEDIGGRDVKKEHSRVKMWERRKMWKRRHERKVRPFGYAVGVICDKLLL
jgi:hypothetical protein